MEQDLYVKKLASEFDISEHAILTEIASDESRQSASYQKNLRERKEFNTDSFGNDERLEVSILYILTRDVRYLDTFIEDV